MGRSFKVSIDGDLSEKEADKIQQTLQKSLAKWFKKGHTIKVEES